MNIIISLLLFLYWNRLLQSDNGLKKQKLDALPSVSWDVDCLKSSLFLYYILVLTFILITFFVAIQVVVVDCNNYNYLAEQRDPVRCCARPEITSHFSLLWLRLKTNLPACYPQSDTPPSAPLPFCRSGFFI